MTANDASRQQEPVNNGDAGLPGQSKFLNTRPRHRRFRRVREEHVLLHTLAERPKHGLVKPSHCERPHSSSLQGHSFQLSISTRQMIDQHTQRTVSSSRNHPCGLRHRQRPASVAGPVVLLIASGLALYSRNFACQLLEILGHRYILQTRPHPWRRAPDHRSLTKIHSRRALGLEEGARSQAVWAYSMDLRGRLCVTGFRTSIG